MTKKTLTPELSTAMHMRVGGQSSPSLSHLPTDSIHTSVYSLNISCIHA